MSIWTWSSSVGWYVALMEDVEAREEVVRGISHKDDWGHMIIGLQYRDMPHPDICNMTGKFYFERFHGGQGLLYKCPTCNSWPYDQEWYDMPRKMQPYFKCEACSDYVCRGRCLTICVLCRRWICPKDTYHYRCADRASCKSFRRLYTVSESPFKHRPCDYCLKSSYRRPCRSCNICKRYYHLKRCYKAHSCIRSRGPHRTVSVYKPPKHYENTAILCHICGLMVSYRAALNHMVLHARPSMTYWRLHRGMFHGVDMFKSRPFDHSCIPSFEQVFL